MTSYFLDVRTLPCPKPIQEAKQQLKKMQKGDVLTVWCKDDVTLLDFKGFCAVKSYSIRAIVKHTDFIAFEIVLAEKA